jgi:DNA-binding MarR family transcriptional regulator
MTSAPEYASERGPLEESLGSDLRILTSESDWVLRSFATQHNMVPNDFRAMLLVIMAAVAGKPLSAGDLRRQMGLSGAAITYMVERMTELGYLLREADPTDRRKVILRYSERGMDLARSFFAKMNSHTQEALRTIPDSELEAAHRAFLALTFGMQDFRAMVSDLASPRT